MYNKIPPYFLTNSTVNYTTTICENILIVITPEYIITSISAIGILLNILNVVVFFKTKSTTIKGDMTKYLIAKSIFDIIYNTCKLFSLFGFLCPQCELTSSFVYQVFYLAIIIYLKTISLVLSIAFDIAATFDRYRIITDNCMFFNKILVFKRGLPLIMCIPVIVFTHRFAIYKIYVNRLFHKTYTVYTVEIKNVSVLPIINLAEKIIIHFSLISLILVFNILMLAKLRSIFKAKRLVTTDREILNRIKKAEARNTFMLILTSPVTIIPNYTFFVINILELINYSEFYNACAQSIGDIIFSLQFTVSFIFYYSFNVNFQKGVHRLICKQAT